MVFNVVGDIFNSLSNEMKDVVTSITTSIKNMFNDGSIVNTSVGGGGGSTGAITTTIKSTETTIIGTLSNKLVQINSDLASKLNATENRLANKLNTISKQIDLEFDNQLGVITNLLKSSTGFITSKIDSQSNIITSKINDSINTIKLATNSIEKNIINRVNQLSTDFIKASEIEIQSDKFIAQQYIKTWSQLFGAFPEQIAIEFSERFENPTLQDYTDFVETIRPLLEENLRNALIDAFNSNEFKNAIHPKPNQFMNFINTIFNGIGATSGVINDIVGITGEGASILTQIADIIGIDSMLSMTQSMLLEPFLRHLYHQSSYAARSDLLSVEQLLAIYLKDKTKKNEVIEGLRYNGLSDSDIQKLFNLTSKNLSEDEIQQLYYRDFFTHSEVLQHLEKLGIDNTVLEARFELWKLIPPIQDIIRFAVRDVFSPEIVEQFGLDENMPKTFTHWAKKVGLSEEWTKAYWSAHWNLPSSNQGFEMFQRGIITKRELEILLQGLDFVPAWRDKMIALNYNPITRVDVRRMRDMGFLTFEEMVKRYQDVGYSPFDAKLLGLWTDEYNNKGGENGESETKALTRSIIIKAYKTGMINRDNAVERLMNIGFDKENSMFILDLEQASVKLDNIPEKLRDNYNRLEKVITKGYFDGTLSEGETTAQLINLGFTDIEAQAEINHLDWEKETQLNTLFVDLVKKQYIQYQFTETKVRELLAENGFTSGETTRLLLEWDIIRIHRSDLPSKAEIKKFLENKLIDIPTAQNYLRGLGYADSLVSLYIQSWGF